MRSPTERSFGGPADSRFSESPVALRPALTGGLPFTGGVPRSRHRRRRPGPYTRRGCPGRLIEALLRRHADGAVEPDDLAVEHPVLDDVHGQRRVLRGLAEALREGHAVAQRLAGLL